MVDVGENLGRSVTLAWAPLAPGPGVEVAGLDLATLTDNDVKTLMALLDEHKVVVLRQAGLTPDEHVKLARLFGSIQLHPYLADLRSSQPYILVMEGTRALAHTFHTDESFLGAPPAVCLLRMHTMPQRGGNTTWIDLEMAYATLSEQIKVQLDGAWGVHRTLDGDREARHPVVRAHPRSARPSLYVNRLYTCRIEGAGGNAGRLLAALIEHSEQDRFAYRLEWTPGDVVIWDNCCTLHRVADDFTTYRRVERVAVGAELPKPFVRDRCGSDH